VQAALVPKELYEHIVEAGVVKSRWRLDRHIVMGLIAGFYIGFSFTVCMVIGGQVSRGHEARGACLAEVHKSRQIPGS
jgi:formate/nitrite transporter FocA (FNT family)